MPLKNFKIKYNLKVIVFFSQFGDSFLHKFFSSRKWSFFFETMTEGAGRKEKNEKYIPLFFEPGTEIWETFLEIPIKK